MRTSRSTNRGPITTGRFKVLMRGDNPDAKWEHGKFECKSAIDIIEKAGFTIVDSPKYDEYCKTGSQYKKPFGKVFYNLGVAIVSGDKKNLKPLEEELAMHGGHIMAIEPEYFVRAISTPRNNRNKPRVVNDQTIPSLKGYRDTKDQALSSLKLRTRFMNTMNILPRSIDKTEAKGSWGLQVTGVLESELSGKGIKIAILDTGFDFDHPDFKGRNIFAEKFVPDATSSKDGDGHGTHCTGIACGPSNPKRGSRYGIAYESDIYIGKVLDNFANGIDGGVIDGINWALNHRCDLISLSLGANSKGDVGEVFDTTYEGLAKRLMDGGTLLIASVGNSSKRPDRIAPVCSPANCPSIMSVAGMDTNGGVVFDSCGAMNATGGEINLIAPGEDVRSSWRVEHNHSDKDGYKWVDGTSAAAPFVTGIAALYAEKTTKRGQALWDELTSDTNVFRLKLPITDMGKGLVQAPK